MNAKGQEWKYMNAGKAQWKEPELITVISEVGGGTNIQSKQARVPQYKAQSKKVKRVIQLIQCFSSFIGPNDFGSWAKNFQMFETEPDLEQKLYMPGDGAGAWNLSYGSTALISPMYGKNGRILRVTVVILELFLNKCSWKACQDIRLFVIHKLARVSNTHCEKNLNVWNSLWINW